MKRLRALGVVLAFVSVCPTSTKTVGTVVVDDGQVGIGLISGGSFGPGSFSIGASGAGRQAKIPVENEDDGDGVQIMIQRPTNQGGHQDKNRQPQRDSVGESYISGGDNNAQLNSAESQKTLMISGQEGKGGQGGSGGGQILIGTVILASNNNKKGNKKKKGNRHPVATDAGALEAIYGSNGVNNSFPSAEYSSNAGQGSSIQIDSLTSGNFGQGAMSLNNNKPSANVLKKEKAVKSGNTGYPNAGNEALYTIGHGANSNGAGNGGDGYNNAQMNSGYTSGSNEEPWIWS